MDGVAREASELAMTRFTHTQPLESMSPKEFRLSANTTTYTYDRETNRYVYMIIDISTSAILWDCMGVAMEE